MRRLTLLAILTLTLAACVPPTGPRGDTAAEPSYPRLAALFSQPDKATAINEANLQRLAELYDIAIFWPDAPSWKVGDTNPVSWVKARAPGVTRLAYAPAGYWWTTDDSCATLPLRCEMRAILDKNGWWLLNPAGGKVEGWSGQALIDVARAARGLRTFWANWYDAALWDGVAWDVTDGNFHYVGGIVDFDRDGEADNLQHGRQWLDDTWTAGLRTLTRDIGAASIGNGAWMPRGEGELSPLAPPLHGSIVELPSRWRDPESGRWLPSANSELIAWHIANLLALKARDPQSVYLVLAKPDLFGTDYWQQYLSDPYDQRRLALGVALLTDNAFLMTAYGGVGWCDECGVANGGTAWMPRWLGQPLASAERAGNVWSRQFEKGAVYVNAGETAAAVQVPGGLRQIKGWYDAEYNAGGAWDGKLAPYGARVLWRSTPEPVATATPTAQPTNTPQPTATPTPEPTVDVADLLRRVEVLEEKLENMRKALEVDP